MQRAAKMQQAEGRKLKKSVLSLIKISVDAMEDDRLQRRKVVSGMHKMAKKKVVKFFFFFFKTGQINHYLRAFSYARIETKEC
jgi:hypothetical protein